MRTNHAWIHAGLVGLLTALPVTARSAPAAPASSADAPPLYVVIENVDDFEFERSRYAFVNGDEIVVSTLRAHAAELANAAQWHGAITVLDAGVRPPDGARVLTLLWDRGEATISDGRKTFYLGVVNRRPLAFHPDHDRVIRQIDAAGLPDARRDAIVRARAEMNLFVALQLATHHDPGS